MTRHWFIFAVGALLLGCPPTATTNAPCAKDADCSQGERCCGEVCRDVRVDVNNCGACANVCSASNGTPSCEGALCKIACRAGYANCDNQAVNGCETALDTDVDNCGACGNVCTGKNSVPRCTSGDCTFGGCNVGFLDCDNLSSTGCETNIDDNVNHCGQCNNKCNLPNAVARCFVQSCQVDHCIDGFGNCVPDGLEPGCETDVRSSNDHCGACDNAVGADQLCIAGTPRPRALVGFGGIDPLTSTATAALWYFAPGENRFQPITAGAPNGAPEARHQHVAVWDAESYRMIVFGGETPNGLASTTVWALDFTANPPEWRKLTTPALDSRIGACAAHDPVGRKVYVFGGTDGDFKPVAANLLVLDLATGAWTQLHGATETPVPEARVEATCAFDPATKKLYVFGGASEVNLGQPSADLWERDLDATTPEWTLVPVSFSPSARYGARFVDGSSPPALFGGRAPIPFSSVMDYPTDVFVLDLSKSDWVVESSDGDPGLPPGRWGHETAVLGARRYVFGGYQEKNTFPTTTLYLDDVWEYDPTKQAWNELWPAGSENGPAGVYGTSVIALEPPVSPPP